MTPDEAVRVRRVALERSVSEMRRRREWAPRPTPAALDAAAQRWAADDASRGIRILPAQPPLR